MSVRSANCRFVPTAASVKKGSELPCGGAERRA
jgi:hypothetical protein